MKILWFINTSSLYNKKSDKLGGGWIESLELLLKESNEIDLAVSFFHKTDHQKIKKNNTTYYPILRKSAKKKPIKTVLNNYLAKENEKQYLTQMLNVVDDFNPDVIHIFGTEEVFSVVQNYTQKPVVIQIQGLMNPCFNNYFPPGISQIDFILNLNYFKQNLIGSSPFFAHKKFKAKAIRESKFLKESKYVMGRTHWDKNTLSLLAPNALYFHVDEVLRPHFYKPLKINHFKNKTIIILSTLSPITYKGLDVVLKTANLLNVNRSISFLWKVIGVEKNNKLAEFFEKKLNILYTENNVIFLGKQSSDEISKLISKADLFVHPSYIDNSPNSVCEAQILELPVIACNVGGVSSIVEHDKTGILVPSNGVHEIACNIRDYNNSPEKYFTLAKNGKVSATKRHNKMLIKNKLLTTYQNIINNAKSNF